MPFNEGTLRAEQRFRDAGGKVWRVVYITPSRAHCTSETNVHAQFKGGDGRDRDFLAVSGQTLDISPTACVELLVERQVEDQFHPANKTCEEGQRRALLPPRIKVVL